MWKNWNSLHLTFLLKYLIINCHFSEMAKLDDEADVLIASGEKNRRKSSVESNKKSGSILSKKWWKSRRSWLKEWLSKRTIYSIKLYYSQYVWIQTKDRNHHNKNLNRANSVQNLNLKMIFSVLLISMVSPWIPSSTRNGESQKDFLLREGSSSSFIF